MDIGVTTTTTGAATSNGTALISALTEEMQAALMKIGTCVRGRLGRLRMRRDACNLKFIKRLGT